ncbi:hypothetical protein [Streptomyces scabiei]|uniref:hypothetical protein n=1 Tax=Streptomyces scabiei TaxID=1930 RepID=UPI001F323180|nr:hypothetical protein [Streptomyces scabiei]
MRGDPGPPLAQPAGAEKVFDWEVAHRAGARRRSRKAIRCGIGLLAFRVVPFAGPPVHRVSGTTGSGLVVLSVAEVLTGSGLDVQVVLRAKPFG